MIQFEKTFVVSSRYLHLPIKNGAPKYVGKLMLKGLTVREFDLELAVEEPADWWAYCDISLFANQELTLLLEGDELDEKRRKFLNWAIQQGDDLLGAEDLYREKYRPQFHFTPRRGWNNDPNGLIYFADLWHLFYQYNPFGVRWGNMHWGHAISPDLFHWQEQPVALYPTSLADMAFSGSAVQDISKSAKFLQAQRSTGIAPLILAFTSTGRGECLAYSLDGGLSFQEYQDNPVLQHTGRDPKVFWYEPDHKWVMIVYEELEDQRGYTIYDSRDLERWQRQQFLPGFFECPELFELSVDADPEKKKWVLYGSTWQQYPSAYQIGYFDGKHFTAETQVLPAHHGPHFYAAQVFNHAPEGRCIMMGWLAGADYPEMPFSQGLTVPLELSLRSCSDGVRLCFNPVEEIAELYLFTTGLQAITQEQANEVFSTVKEELLDIKLQLTPDPSQVTALNVRGYPIIYDSQESSLKFSGKKAPLDLRDSQLNLRVLVDRSVIEVFAGQGEVVFAAMTIFPDDSRSIILEGVKIVNRLTVHSLKSIWTS